MATTTFRPTGAGTYSQWTTGGGANYTNVDETAADGDSTKNTTTTSLKFDSFAHSTTITTTAISPILDVYVTMKSSSASTALPLLFCISGANEGFQYPNGGPVFLGTDYVEYVFTFSAEPISNDPWTATLINACEFGYSAIIGSGSPTMSVTQCYAIVTYEVPTEGTAAPSLNNLAAAGTALKKHTASGTPSLNNLNASGTGVMHPKATGACTLPHLRANGSNAQRILSGDATLPNLTAAAEGEVDSSMIPIGTATCTLPSLTCSASAKRPQKFGSSRRMTRPPGRF